MLEAVYTESISVFPITMKEEKENMLKELRVDNSAPWKQRFHAASIFWTMIATEEPTRGLVASNLSGIAQLYAWDVPTGMLTQLTDRPQGQLFGTLSPDGRYVYYHREKEGNEIGHFVRLPFEGGEIEDITPQLAPYASFGLRFSRAGNLLMFMAATPEGFKVYLMENTSDGKLTLPTPIHQSASIIMGLRLSYKGDLLVIGTTERSRSLQMNLLALDTRLGQPIAELWDEKASNIRAGAFSPVAGDDRMLATTDRSGVARPLIWNPRTGECTDLVIDALEGEVTPADWSPDGKHILLTHFSQAVQHLSIYDIEHQTLMPLHVPGGSLGWGPPFASFAYFGSRDEIFAHWEDSTHPLSLIALSLATGEQTRTVLNAGSVPAGHPWRSITFTSSDGKRVQGWLGLPDGQGPFPTILEMHGGPTVVQAETFSPASQAWLDAGFAFLTINYHGSTTFGREFERSIWGDLGHWEMEDMVAAREWLVDQGIARPDAILLTGWSYGGYLTLLGLGKYPDLWAAGMAGAAVTDWAMQYEDMVGTLKGYQRALLGGTPEEQPERYIASSPITYAANVRVPMLIIQGRNDTRTPARPVEIYEKTIKDLGKEIEVVWFDSGHSGSFTQVERSIEHQELMLRFAYRVLAQD
jgi:dipeptidyl aminopeptidase/acylaminoacyl peptidase